jgi:hypothetical protein
MKYLFFALFSFALFSVTAQVPTKLETQRTKIVMDSITIESFNEIFGEPTIKVSANGREFLAHNVVELNIYIYYYESITSKYGRVREIVITINQ